MSSLPIPQSDEQSTQPVVNVEQFSSNDFNTGAETMADNIKNFNAAVIKFNASCEHLNGEKAAWEGEKVVIGNTQKFDSQQINLNLWRDEIFYCISYSYCIS